MRREIGRQREGGRDTGGRAEGDGGERESPEGGETRHPFVLLGKQGGDPAGGGAGPEWTRSRKRWMRIHGVNGDMG